MSAILTVSALAEICIWLSGVAAAWGHRDAGTGTGMGASTGIGAGTGTESLVNCRLTIGLRHFLKYNELFRQCSACGS